MPLRRRYTAPCRANLYSPAQAGVPQGTWAPYNNHYSYGPQLQLQSSAYSQPYLAPTPQPSAPIQSAVISPEDDVQRLFNACKVGRGNAELLHEVLVYAKPQELKNEVTKELLERARASIDLIGSQIPWATTEAERSRRAAYTASETTQEQLLAALLGAHEQLTECIKMYDDLERLAVQQEEEERMKTERLIQALTAVAEYRPSSEEARLIDWVFTTGDPERTGKVNPQTATRIFSASNLPPDALARIWEIASVDSKDGLLDRQGVGVALRLIGHAQEGLVVAEELVTSAGPLAVLENISPVPSEPVAGPSSGVPFSAFPPLTSHDRAKFRKIFKGSGAQNGILGGQEAREVFMKSRLPWNTLSDIWALADTHRRGFLDVTDFTIAMYLIQALMTGRLTTVPSSLPQSLFEAAAQQSPSPSPSPSYHTLPQHTLPAPPLHLSRIPHPTSPFAGPPPPPRHPSHPIASRIPPQPSSPGWDISPATKVQANHVFSSLDPRNKGRVKGEAVRSYIHQSGLSTSATGRIWDMVDIGHKGYLTREEFAVAMHLVKIRKEGHHLPNALPPGLLPTPTAEDDDDAYTGIIPDASQRLQVPGGISRHSSSHHLSASEDGTRPTSTVSGLRSSRSTPLLPSLGMLPPASPLLTSASTPFPMSPLPGPMGYIPSQATTVAQWNIKPEDRARYDRYFEQLDSNRQGYLLSDVAVPFFARAKLPNDVMATIWDMADSEHDGRLTHDDFAVAMHLIRQKLAGKDLPAAPTAPAVSPIRTTPSPSPQPGAAPTPSRRSSRPTPPQRSSTGSGVEAHTQPTDPTTVRLPDDVDDDLRSDTPPPPYELIASDTT
ncbi:EF-hand [Lentinus tigrinus ALCF2SS1-7]|uniref:EF-hand n=1 Tax=Lentinus tigrinus ALCF2SS1-6 TaxID=1328759 RepID=A0A5C2SYL0_9APHY|nr:EF-hand [Lentinus tigrinus ALCF2SS1-6]RPD79792.1 EF-hand [Lentinus tigrinus ALCF2SS1-7]